MSWPSPPGDDRDDAPDDPGSPQEQLPWRPTAAPRGEQGPRGEAPTAPAGATVVPPPSAPARRRRGGLPIAVAAVGVVALLGAGWLAIDRGLLSGGEPSSGDGPAVLADVTQDPSQTWTYNYLPRGGGDYSSDRQVVGSDMVILTGPLGYADDPGDEEGSVTLLDLDTGQEEWSVPLDLSVHDPETPPSVSLGGTFGDRVLIQSWSHDYDDVSEDTTSVGLYSMLALADGAEVWRSERDEVDPAMSAVGEPGAMIFVDDREVTRVDPRDPDGSPLWQAPHPFEFAQATSLGDDYLLVSEYEGEGYVGEGVVLDIETGEEPGWFDVSDPDLTYRVVGGDVYRIETGSRGSYLERLEDDGSASWSADADAFVVKETASGEVVIFALEEDRSASESTGYEFVQRLDPRNGEEMWEEGIETEFSTLESVVDDVVELYTDRGTSDLYSLADGERVARLRADPNYAGRETLYALQDGRLEAYSTEGEQLWSTRTSDTESIVHAPGYLLTDDTAAGRLTRWE